ncbi:hypothetical protein BC936DRAFT_146696 [Jimgerdemannia flammicorona]|uniref:Uncharacterized protein n=1 Tax=Jimgerdemannia flammicorona TaxID=994334 RepID=A0A433D6X6_9FUNG|nr:hypothetical protein BC936DRAFT_146696 [Jimgerdemannia flammicorona]
MDSGDQDPPLRRCRKRDPRQLPSRRASSIRAISSVESLSSIRSTPFRPSKSQLLGPRHRHLSLWANRSRAVLTLSLSRQSLGPLYWQPPLMVSRAKIVFTPSLSRQPLRPFHR